MTTGAVAVEGASPRKRLTAWTLGVLGVTFLAGLLFGYDQGVISGALPILSSDLGLSTLQAEVITSWVTLGALVGALVAGAVADRAGRRRAAMVAESCSRSARSSKRRHRARTSSRWVGS